MIYILSFLFSNNWKELEGDIVLRRYGIFLSLAEPLTFVFHTVGDFKNHVHLAKKETPPICWSFFQRCHKWRIFATELELRAWLEVMCFLGVVASLLFCASCFYNRKGVLVKCAHVTLLLSVLMKILFVLLDFRFRTNQHLMALWTSSVFLFYPTTTTTTNSASSSSRTRSSNKRDALRILLVAFYFWAGILKLNFEWLSGSTLYRPLRPLWLFQAHPIIIPASCAYVIVLELVVIWGFLVSTKKQRILFWSTLAQLYLFHLLSFWIVGFFYPILMYLLLMIGPLSYWEESHNSISEATNNKVSRMIEEKSEEKKDGTQKTDDTTTTSTSTTTKNYNNNTAKQNDKQHDSDNDKDKDKDKDSKNQEQSSLSSSPPSSSSSLLYCFFHGTAPKSVYIVFGFFSLVQLWTKFALTGNAAITGEGRFASLHMFDAKVVCNMEKMFTIDYSNSPHPGMSSLPPQPVVGPKQGRGSMVPGLSIRHRCDPWVQIQVARILCENLKKDKQKYDGATINFLLESRLSSEKEYQVVVDEKDVCGRFRLLGEEEESTNQKKKENNNNSFQYKWWTHNDWIRVSGSPNTKSSSSSSSSSSPPRKNKEL